MSLFNPNSEESQLDILQVAFNAALVVYTPFYIQRVLNSLLPTGIDYIEKNATELDLIGLGPEY